MSPERERAIWRSRCAGHIPHPISAESSISLETGGSIGPESNTGQKGSRSPDKSSLAPPLIDWCSVTFPPYTLKRLGLASYHDLLEEVFGTKGKVVLGVIEEKRWNFFSWSAVLIDETGTLCGRLGLGERGETHISLTGQGCKHVRSWAKARAVIEDTGAHMTRLDIAIDDFAGHAVNLPTFRRLVDEGAFINRGRPPICQFVDDLGSGKGCTLYIGQRGYKQLCIYEKGKQLGDPESDYCRVELRLYNKHHVINPAALTEPAIFFAGAYEVLADFIGGEVEKLEAKERQNNPSAKAMVASLKRQCGSQIGLLHEALGDEFLEFVVDQVAREGRPGRFKSFVGDLPAFLRTHLQKDPPDPAE